MNIFTVLVFTKDQAKQLWKSDLHYVCANSSQEAEGMIEDKLQTYNKVMSDPGRVRSFITTDGHIERNPQKILTFVTEIAKDDPLTDAALDTWVYVMTYDMVDMPAIVREIK